MSDTATNKEPRPAKSELAQAQGQERNTPMNATILNEQSKHPLPVILRELKWGRSADEQRFLIRLADALEGGATWDSLLDGSEPKDSADWWKQKPTE